MKTRRRAVVLIPPDLLAEIEAAAAEEHQPAHKLVGEAVERYLSQRRWFRSDEVLAKIAKGPIWASGRAPRKHAGHTTATAPREKSLPHPLTPKGRSTHALRFL
jgi:hypothetical protein